MQILYNIVQNGLFCKKWHPMALFGGRRRDLVDRFRERIEKE
jgi:hypothetical protein